MSLISCHPTPPTHHYPPNRNVAQFPMDLAHATLQSAAPSGLRNTTIYPFLIILEEAAAGQTPLLMTSTWSLDYARVTFGAAGGPAAAAPCLSPGFPLVVAQPAPAGAAGGGMDVYVWLWGKEHEEMCELVAEL
jgi:hypothetical protein